MTTANKITILRILLVPFFVVEILYYVRSGNELHRVLGLASFALAAILDGVDGFVARHFNQRSELGTFLDPLADKLLLVSGIIILSADHGPRLGQLPLWLTGTILGRDFLLGLGVVTIRLVVGKITVNPRLSGKMATVFQMVAVVWLLLRWDVSFPQYYLKIWFLGAGILTGLSGLLYVWDGTQQLSSHPSSSPTSDSNSVGTK
jgi:CDP-diacylglycerol--glycerol-3-phosphate 3-phosphatidyltransferase